VEAGAKAPALRLTVALVGAGVVVTPGAGTGAADTGAAGVVVPGAVVDVGRAGREAVVLVRAAAE
jgi:hypothetical protein